MKREGRQHGMVRTYRILPPPLNPRPESRLVNSFTSPPTAGIFTKVPSKPTNHSKFTGKCGIARCIGCHMHPTTKSKVKTKGATKLRSNDITSSGYKLLTWRVMNGPRPIMNLSGVSATGILDFMLDDSYASDCENKEKDDQIMKSEEKDDGGDNSDKEESGPHDSYDDESMSFYDVEMMMMDHVVDDAEDDWCLV